MVDSPANLDRSEVVPLLFGFLFREGGGPLDANFLSAAAPDASYLSFST
jgi:hypothetical protein